MDVEKSRTVTVPLLSGARRNLSVRWGERGSLPSLQRAEMNNKSNNKKQKQLQHGSVYALLKLGTYIVARMALSRETAGAGEGAATVVAFGRSAVIEGQRLTRRLPDADLTSEHFGVESRSVLSKSRLQPRDRVAAGVGVSVRGPGARGRARSAG